MSRKSVILVFILFNIQAIFLVRGSSMDENLRAPPQVKTTRSGVEREFSDAEGGSRSENALMFNKALRKHNAVVLSVCNAAKSRFCNFVKSSQSNGALLHVIGYGAQWTRNVDKLFAMNQEVKKYSNDTIIIFCDCMDVVFNDDIETTITRFIEKKVDMVVAVEYACWPADIITKIDPSVTNITDGCVKAYDIVGSKNSCMKNGPRYINSGTYIAYAGFLKTFLGDVCDEIVSKNYRGYSDQKYFHEAHLTGRRGILLDHCVEFFMGMLFIETSCYPTCPWVRRNFDYLEYIPTGNRPSFVHFQYDTKVTIYDKYINSTLVEKESKRHNDVPMFWINGKPKKTEELCPH